MTKKSYSKELNLESFVSSLTLRAQVNCKGGGIEVINGEIVIIDHVGMLELSEHIQDAWEEGVSQFWEDVLGPQIWHELEDEIKQYWENFHPY